MKERVKNIVHSIGIFNLKKEYFIILNTLISWNFINLQKFRDNLMK